MRTFSDNITLILVSVLAVFLLACTEKKEEKPVYYIEEKPSFFDLRHGDLLTSEWIRKPENLWMVHETVKAFGYNHLLEDAVGTSGVFFKDVYVDKPVSELLDSLILTYEDPSIQSDYYNKFWQRRKTEGNEAVVYKIVKEIDEITQYKSDVSIFALKPDLQQVNDTLKNLLEIEFNSDNPILELAQKNFNILKKYGMHQSAYNLALLNYGYSDLEWNVDSLLQTLSQSEEVEDSWIEEY